MTKISIDLPIILDPHKLLMVLGGLGSAYDEILAPDGVRFIEAWGIKSGQMQLPPMTLRLLEETYDDRFDSFFGFSSDRIVPENFCAGIRLFQYALKQDMVSLFESSRLTEVGREALGGSGYFPPFYRQGLPSGLSVNINPDAPHTLESLIGLEEEQGVAPLFGDLDFLKVVQERRPQGSLHGNSGVLEVHDDTQELLSCPQALDFEELIWYVQNREHFNKISTVLRTAVERRHTGRDMGVIGLKFGGTTALDNIAFGGVPLSSGAVFLYDMYSRYLRARPADK